MGLMKKRNHKKINLVILFGGKSVEHEVSVQSARNIVQAIDKRKYNIKLVSIDKKGVWPPSTVAHLFSKKIDVVFPILHGPFGEDGTIQGLLKFANVPFVGTGVLGSAVGMDKDVMKRLLRDNGLPIAKFLVYKSHEREKIIFEKVKRVLGLPFFVKPANLGSSVGVTKVRNKHEFIAALASAFLYDSKILIEEYIKGKEIECSILGNKKPIASVCGEVTPNHDFYSYEAKYLDENGALLSIPANISKQLMKKIQRLALEAYKVLCCEGMARVDFFVTKNEKVFINEINTIPGFTAISMYPKLWGASGIPYAKLIDILIKLAIGRFNKEQKLKTSIS